MEKSGDQEHRCYDYRSRDICGQGFNLDNRTGVDRSGDVAAEARKQAVAVLVGFYLANRRIRHRCDRKERQQNERSHPQVMVLSPAI